MPKLKWSDRPCWIWGGKPDKDGRPRWRGRCAYRLMYEKVIGPCPAGMDAHHLCHTPMCVNPWHLEWLPHNDHSRLHGDEKMASNTQCPAGHEFTPENTYEYIRKDGRREKHCRTCHRDRMYARSTPKVQRTTRTGRRGR